MNKSKYESFCWSTSKNILDVWCDRLYSANIRKLNMEELIIERCYHLGLHKIPRFFKGLNFGRKNFTEYRIMVFSLVSLVETNAEKGENAK